MRILADLHISPRTIEFLRSLGHDVVRANDVLPIAAADEQIVALAIAESRTVLTQDLDLSAIIALEVLEGVIVTVEDHRVRRRLLPIL
jgi:predicted nuclease of predicted toxin-antitoxin system